MNSDAEIKSGLRSRVENWVDQLDEAAFDEVWDAQKDAYLFLARSFRAADALTGWKKLTALAVNATKQRMLNKSLLSRFPHEEDLPDPKNENDEYVRRTNSKSSSAGTWIEKSLTDEDKLTAKALALYSIVEPKSHLGINISQFRNKFLKGTIIPLTEIDVLFQTERNLWSTPSPQKSVTDQLVSINKAYADFFDPDEPLNVPSSSMLAVAKPIADRISRRFDCSFSEATTLLFSGSIPNVLPLRINPFALSARSFEFGEYAPSTLQIEVANWLPPQRVAQAIKLFQSKQTIHSKSFKKERLELLVFVLTEMSCHYKGETISQVEWGEIHAKWQLANPNAADRPCYKELSQFKDEYYDVKKRLVPQPSYLSSVKPLDTAIAQTASVKKRGGKRAGAGRPKKNLSPSI